VQAFGKFTDFSLDFSAPPKGLNLIYGPNEAGKSTLLRALTAFLFGFHHRVQDDFLHPSSSLAVSAELVGPSQQVCEWTRLKKRKGAFLDVSGEAAPEEHLAELLGGLSEAQFLSMYALNRQRLEEGARQLLQGKGELGASLFSAASGLAKVYQASKDLEDTTDELYRDRGGQRYPLNAALLRGHEAEQSCVASQVSPQAWLRLQEEVQSEEGRAKEAKTRRAVLMGRLNVLECQRALLPLLLERQSDLRELAALEEVPVLDGGGVEERKELQLALQSQEQRRALAHEQIEALKEKELALSFDATIVQQGQAIEAAYESSVRAEQARFEEERLKRESAELAQRRRELEEVFAPQLSVEARANWPALSIVEQQAKQLQQRHVVLRERLGALEDAQHERISRRHSLEAGRAGLTEPCDLAPLQHWVQQREHLLAMEREHEELALRLYSSDEQVNLRFAELQWSRGQSLPDPKSWLARAERLEEARKRQVEGALELGALRRKQAELKARLETAAAQHRLVSENELSVQRQERDRLWKGIRADAARLAQDAEALSLALETCDETADALRRDAQRLAEIAEWQRDLAACDAELSVLVDSHTTQLGRCQEIEQEWANFWKDYGSVPESLQSAERWIQSVQALQQSAQHVDELRQRVEYLSDQLAKARKALELAFPTDLKGESLVADLAVLEQLLTEERAQQARYERLDSDLAKFRQDEHAAAEQIARVKEQIDCWQADWEDYLRSLQIEGELSVSAWEQLFSKICTSYKLREQEERAQQGLQACAQRLHQQRTQEQSLRELLPGVAELSLAQLYRHLREEQEREQQIRLLRTEREEAEARAASVEARYTELEAQKQQLFQQAAVDSWQALAEIDEQSRHKRQLQRRLEDIEAQLRQRQDLVPLSSYEELLQKTSQDLEMERQLLADELDALNRQITDVDQNLGERRAQLRRWEEDAQRGDAAAAATEKEAAYAEVRQLTRRYLRERLAASLLKRTTERYRQKHQGPLLERAGQLFKRMTLGSFETLRTAYGIDEDPVIVGVRPDGKDLPVEGMSCGTAEQLYLALRLACLEARADGGLSLPLLLDDTLLDSDDARSRAVVDVCRDLGSKMQILLFTHHRSLLDWVQESAFAEARELI
jgi:uncharacterized protein YhaN